MAAKKRKKTAPKRKASKRKAPKRKAPKRKASKRKAPKRHSEAEYLELEGRLFKCLGRVTPGSSGPALTAQMGERETSRTRIPLPKHLRY